MKEVRVRWLFGLHEDQEGRPTDGGIWFPDTPENRHDAEVIVECGVEVAGPGTHWLEERDERGDLATLSKLGVPIG